MPKTIPFIEPNTQESDFGYFEKSIEDDPTVFFHGTSYENAEAILLDGFKPSQSLGLVYFTSKSRFAMQWASAHFPMSERCILAVKFEKPLEVPFIKDGEDLKIQGNVDSSMILQVCKVPEKYQYL